MCEFYTQADPASYESRSHSIRIAGVITSIRLENLFWQTLAELAAEYGVSTNQLIGKLYADVQKHRGEMTNFASFLRVTCHRYQALKASAAFEANTATGFSSQRRMTMARVRSPRCPLPAESE